MKKTLKFFAAAALVAFAAVACQKEQLSDSPAEGTESVTFTVQTEVGTKAVADGDGKAAKIDTVLVAVYMKDGASFRLYDEPVATYTASNKQATFSVNLIRKQTYQIVVWAQKKGAYVCTDGLQSIVRSSAKASACNDDELDAFYASHEYVQGSASASTSIVAKRPFAQLNLITKDLRTGFEPSDVTVTYVSDTKFNALTGLSSEQAATAVTYSATQPNYQVQDKPLNAAQNTLVMNYLFAPESEQIILPSVKMTAKLTEVVDFEVSNVPVKRNYRTNVIGNLLSEQTDFTISVVPTWGDPDIDVESVPTVAAANAALQAGKTNVAIESVENNSEILIPETSNNIGISLPSRNANAVTIKYLTSSESGQTPNLNVAAESNTGNLVINAPQSHVTLNGAAYNNVTASTSNTTLVVEEGVTIERLTVDQGAVEIYGTVKNITLADGCPIKVWAVGDEATWNLAYEKGAQTISLKNSFEISNTLEIGRSLDIQGNGYEISHGTGSAQNSRVVNINGLNDQEYNFYNTIFSEKSTGAYSRGINVLEGATGSKITLDGCTVSAGYYALNFIIGPSDLEFTIKNGTVAAGWAAINCYANNSTFTIENSTLKGLNDKGESSWNDFSTIVFDGNGLRNAENIGVNGTGNSLNVVNSTIYASSESSNNQSWLALQYGAQRNIVNVDAATRIIDAAGNDQTYNICLAPIVGYVSETEYKTYDLKSEIWIGGSFVYPGYEASIGSKYYVTLAEALAAVKAGETVQILKSGEYALETLTGENYTLEAVAEGVVLKHTPKYGSWIASCTGTVTVKNLTWDVGVVNYQYFQNVDAENCTIKGCPFAHTKVNFKSCNFVVESSDVYNI